MIRTYSIGFIVNPNDTENPPELRILATVNDSHGLFPDEELTMLVNTITDTINSHLIGTGLRAEAIGREDVPDTVTLD